MYLESDKKLRDLLATDGSQDDIKDEDSQMGTLFIDEPQIETSTKDEQKHVEEIFVEETKIDQHLKFECPICLQRFRTKRTLTKHSNVCETPTTSSLPIDNIDQPFLIKQNNDADEIVEHIKIEPTNKAEDETDEHDNNFECKNCLTKHDSSESLAEHHKVCSVIIIKGDKSLKAKNPDANGNWICEKCGEAHSSKIALREHRKTHREPKKYTENEETGEFICDVCSKSFDTKEKIQFHVRRHGDIKCLCNVW